MKLGLDAAYAGNPARTPILLNHDHTRLVIWKDHWVFKQCWAGIEAVRGTYDWSILDRSVSQLCAGKRNLIFVLGFVPLWATGRVATPSELNLGYALAGPVDLSAWREWCSLIATRYRGQMNFEIMNEPTTWMRDDPNGPATVAEMTRIAAYEIHAVDQGARVLNAPLSNIIGSIENAGSALGLYQRMFSAKDSTGVRTADHIDVVSTHTYVGAHSLANGVAGYMPAFRAMLAANGAGALPIWSTECGSDVASVDGRVQFMRDAIPMHEALGFDSLTWHVWDSADNYGLWHNRAMCKAWMDVSAGYT